MEQIVSVTHKAAGVLKALICTGILTAVGLVVLAFLLLRLELDESAVKIGIVLIYIISGAGGGFLLGKINKKRKFLWGIFLGALYFAILLIITAAAYQMPEIGDAHFLKMFFACCAGGMLGGIIS